MFPGNPRFLVLHSWEKLDFEYKLTFDGQHNAGGAAAGSGGHHTAVLPVVSRYSASNREHRPIRTDFYVVYRETGRLKLDLTNAVQ